MCHRRRIWLAVVLVCATGAVVSHSARAEQIEVVLRGATGLPTAAVDQDGQPFIVREMSGVTYLGGDAFAAVMDDGGKIVTFDVAFEANGGIASAAVTAGLSLADVRDFEGIAYVPGATPATVYVSEEDTPAVHAYRLTDGGLVATLATPAVFGQRRSNLGFEALARMPGTGVLWTGNEGALSVDGPLATTEAGTTVRLLEYTPAGGGYEAGAQYAYEVDPLHGAPISGSRSGLVELVATPVPIAGGGLLAVERSLALSTEIGAFRTAMYAIDFGGATDVSEVAALDGATYTPVTKTELFAGAVVPGGMNLEGLAVGPAIGPGRWAMLGVVDDGDPISTNTLVAFELTILPDGDVNRDAVVDGLDANVIALNWQAEPATREQGDLNGDGRIDGLDANIVSRDWLKSTDVTSVPEPEGMGLWLFSTWLAWAGLRR